MNILFTASVEGNSGPANVNRELVAHWPSGDQVMTIKAPNKFGRAGEFFRAIIIADVVIAIGGTAVRERMAASYIRMDKHKKLVVLSHGYAPYENEINHLHYSKEAMIENRDFLAKADAVVAVSRHHMHFLEKQQPNLADHLAYINNAIDPFTQEEHDDYDGNAPLTVAVSGGDRPVKGNEVVARSVSILRKQGIDCRLLVFGDIDGHNPEFDQLLDKSWVTSYGQIPRADFILKLRTTSVFVMNSIYEPFGLSALDALEAGCPVLLSAECGVNDVLGMQNKDVIENNQDAQVIARQILAIAHQSNAERLYRTIDFSKLNWTVSAQRLRDICHAVVNKEDLREFMA